MAPYLKFLRNFAIAAAAQWVLAAFISGVLNPMEWNPLWRGYIVANALIVAFVNFVFNPD